MKLNKKTIYIAIGCYFLWSALSGLLNVFSSIGTGQWLNMPLYILPLNLAGVVVNSLVGLKAVQVKKRGKLLSGIAWCHLALTLFLPMTMGAMFASSVTFAAVRAGLLYLTQMEFDAADKAIRGDMSEAEKIEIQAGKQESIYDEQLKAGILTQEEYEQLTAKDK